MFLTPNHVFLYHTSIRSIRNPDQCTTEHKSGSIPDVFDTSHEFSKEKWPANVASGEPVPRVKNDIRSTQLQKKFS